MGSTNPGGPLSTPSATKRDNFPVLQQGQCPVSNGAACEADCQGYVCVCVFMCPKAFYLAGLVPTYADVCGRKLDKCEDVKELVQWIVFHLWIRSWCCLMLKSF